MPPNYRRTPGSRRYIDYTKDELDECLAAVRSKVLTQRAASKQYNIPRRTIKNKLQNKYTGNPGRPTVFTAEEEAAFVVPNDVCSMIHDYVQNYIPASVKNLRLFSDGCTCQNKNHTMVTYCNCTC